jgi:hypothetical protein
VSVPTYVDFRMNEWGCVQSSVRRVLNELDAEPLLALKDPRFEVMILPEATY